MLLTDKDRLLNDNYTSVVFIHYVGIPLHFFFDKNPSCFQPPNFIIMVFCYFIG